MPEVNATSSATLAADLMPLWLRDELLDIGKKTTVFADLAQDIPMPEGEGKTIQANRFERIPLPMAPAVEGTTPTATPLTLSTVQAILDQWIVIVSLTDVGLMTSKHPVLQVARDRLGTNAGELWDREIQRVLMGGANVVFPNGRTARSQLIAGDTLTSDLAALVTATLRQLGAPTVDARGAFAGVIDPYVEQDLNNESGFVQAHTYQEVTALYNGEVGLWKGVRFKRSNLLPIISLLAAGNYAIAAANAGAPASGETNFAAGTSVPVIITKLDDIFGFETLISVSTAVTDAGTFSVQVQIASAAASGRYNVYVGLESAVIATLQTQVSHVVGTADTRTFIKGGVPSAVNRFVTQATGPVAPPVPPATGNVHVSYITGKNAFGVSKIGPRMKAFLTPVASTDSDPAMQRRKCGYKNFFKPLILNTDFFRRLETTSAFN